MASVDIRPPTDVYATFGRLNYRVWHALAEFVDNATESGRLHRATLEQHGQPQPYRLKVEVRHSAEEIRVEDNAHGMNLDEMQRALRLSTPPPDRSGRSEFGMGLKTAACWFGHRWTLSTTRLGHPVRYTATMDLDEISRTRATSLRILEEPAPADEHGTTLVIGNLRNRIYGRAGERTKKTLASMYRQDLRNGSMVLVWQGERLGYEDAPLHTDVLPDGEERPWRQDLYFRVKDPSTDQVHVVEGWAGIRAKMSRKEAGFALMRRGRLIIGGYDDGWRPDELVGQMGSAVHQRLVGELNCDSFPVNFSKDGFAWDSGLQEELIATLKPILADYRRKANDIRQDDPKVRPVDLDRAVRKIEESYATSDIARDEALLEARPRDAERASVDQEVVARELQQRASKPSVFVVPMAGDDITARVYYVDERPTDPWLQPAFPKQDEVEIYINMAHPFIASHTAHEASFDAVVQMAVATVLAEKRARFVGGETVRPDDLRMHIDNFLRHATR